MKSRTIYQAFFFRVIIISLFLGFLFSMTGPVLAQISFTGSDLAGAAPSNPSSLQFGPDGRLYVAEQNGLIQVYTVIRNDANDYSATATETIDLVRNIQNHDDDGSFSGITGRQVTGLLVTGTGSNPVLYVGSSDPRIGAGGSGTDADLDTNSGIISRLTWNGSAWDKVDLVRGLPRSEENHGNNGMQLDEQNSILYVASGGNTNAGGPSNNFAYLTEYALSAAILSVDLTVIDAMTTEYDVDNDSFYKYDLPTVDDPTRAQNPDLTNVGDPFGGNDGLNQARLDPAGPVQIYAPGFRNAYDLVITSTPGREGRMYTVDNGANSGWGGYPADEGPGGICTNDWVSGEPGSVNNLDGLHFIAYEGYYGGHPAPIRANPADAGLYWYDNDLGQAFFELNPTSDWPPVPVSMANPVECDFQQPGVDDGALITYGTSTNGLTEYTASNFQGAMEGDLLAAGFNGNIYRIVLNQAGDQVLNGTESFASNFGSLPLDVTAQGDPDIFPGTVWVAVYGSAKVTVFEPSDYDGGGSGPCTGDYDDTIDEDEDGYSNADEIDNLTNPCSAASKPADHDGDFISDLNDPDDDNDGIPDTTDYFAIDADNGTSTGLPVSFSLFNNDPGYGFFGVGFTGLMVNGMDYQDLFVSDDLVVGGAAGLFTIQQVSAGDALENDNTQENGFQFGVDVSVATGPFTVRTRLLSPYFGGQVPQDDQSFGLYISNGDQDNYLKIVFNANGGSGGFRVLQEDGSFAVNDLQFSPAGLLASTFMDLYLSVDPAAGTVQPGYALDGGTVNDLGTPLALSGQLLNAVQGTPAMAVGFIATSSNAVPFSATWDFVEVLLDPATSSATVDITPSGGINASTYTSGSFQLKNTSTEGQRITRVWIDFSTAFFPDMVFDPDGTAGDTVAKDFTVDFDSGVGLIGQSFAGFHNGVDGDDGFDALEITFNNFDPGESFTFSVDVDPTSIKGTSAPGPGESGSVSGLELTGTTVSVEFDDGFTHTVDAYRLPGSASGSGNIVQRAGPPKPGIEVLGLPVFPAVVSQSQQTIRVIGPVGADASLLIIEGALFLQGLPGGGYDLDSWEANSAILINEINTTVGASGVVDIPVTLTDSDPEGALNYIIATLVDSDGMTGPISDVVILEYDADANPVPDARINAGGPEVTTGGNTWSADQYFSGSTSVFTNVTEINGTSDDVLYHTERFGSSFSYSIPVNDGLFTVNLHFAETWFGAPGGGPAGGGNRVFSVNIENGQAGLSDYDIYLDVGAVTAVVKTFQSISVTDGFLDISFSATVDNAKISAIEIFSEAGGSTAILTASPDPLHFGQQVVDTTSVLDLILTNTGNTSLNVTDVSITGTDAGQFDFDLSPPFAVVPGTPVNLDITFAPTTTGSKTALITITHTGDNSPVTADLAGESLDVQTAVLDASPDPLDFGQQVVNTSSALDLILTNTGNTSLNVTDVSITGTDAGQFDFDLSPPFAVDPGTPVNLAITFAPTTPGSKTALITITHTGDNSPVTVDLAGESLDVEAAVLDASPDPLDFGRQVVDAPITLGLTVTNTGNTALDVTDLTVTGTDAGAFNFDLTPPFAVNPGTPVTLNVTFIPPAPGGTSSAVLTFTHTGDNSPVTVDLLGEGVGPGSVLFRVNAGGLELTSGDGSQPSWNSDLLAAPSTYVNVPASGDETYSVTNTITLDASVPASAPMALFQWERWDPPSPSEEMQWNFPVPDGDYEVRLYFSEIYDLISGPDQREFSVLIEGSTVLTNYDIFENSGGLYIGVMESFVAAVSDGNLTIDLVRIIENPAIKGIEILPVSGPQGGMLDATPDPLDFGRQATGAPSSRNLTLANTGTAPLAVTDVTITGTDASLFNYNLAQPFDVDPGFPVDFSVTFTPNTVGSKSAVLTITHTGDNSPVTVTLTGKGIALGTVLTDFDGSGLGIDNPGLGFARDRGSDPSWSAGLAGRQAGIERNK